MDDQQQTRIREEAEAVEFAMMLVRQRFAELVSSDALELELLRNPSAEERSRAQMIISEADVFIETNTEIVQRAAALSSLGYGRFDALHLACAEIASADALLTTDDKFAKRAGRGVGQPRVAVVNPLFWMKERQA